MRLFDEARAAAGLLTIVPVGGRELPADVERGAAPWFVPVGALVGVAAAVAYSLGEGLLGGAYAAALALTVSALATGALHHDGLADTADGLGARGGPERRLAAMRDSGIGAYGALALVLYVLLATAALARLGPADATSALVCGHALSRWATLPQLATVPPARADGLGAGWSIELPGLAIGTVAALAIALATVGFVPALSAFGAAIVASGAVALLARRAIGGRTGDTLGAAVLVSEVVVYSVLAAYWLT